MLAILAVHSEGLPHQKRGTQYAYAEAEQLADAKEVEHDHHDEGRQQASCKEGEVLRFQPLNSTVRPTPLLISQLAMAYKKKERRIVAATMRKIQAPNQEAAVLLVSGSPEENLL